VYDAVLTDDGRTTRAPFSIGPAQAPQFEAGSTTGGLMAEHGFSAMGSLRRRTTTTTLLVDTGLSPGAMITNAGRPGADLSQIQAVAPATATSTRPAAWPVSPGRRGPGRYR
jgi:7,8-dihydropterin-6-yl-methyl-4-(beta-D-ribofuranosyl)aminobenzene 5'-phosphate synthase